MSDVSNLAKSFLIFAQYSGAEALSVSAEHDVIYAGTTPSLYSDEHRAELKKLGWTEDDEQYECWIYFT